MKKEDFLNYNENDEAISINQLGVTNKVTDLRFDERTNTQINSLAADSEVKFPVTFRPKTAGKYVLEAKFNYAEGEEVTAATEITVTEALLEVIIITGLPKQVPANSLHKVELLVRNQKNSSAILKTIEPGSLVRKSISISLNGKAYTLEEFNLLSDEDKLLKQDENIKIVGDFQAKNVPISKQTLGLKVNYRVDGVEESVQADHLAGAFTEVIAEEKPKIIVTGSVKPKEKSMRFGGEEAIEFIFKNTNPEHPATGVEITITSTKRGKDLGSEVKKN